MKREIGFYKVENIYTQKTYNSSFEVAFWTGENWSVLGWDSLEKDSYFNVLERIS